MVSKEHDYAMEKRLRELDPGLHSRFTAAVFGLQNILQNYKLIFPTFTDHTELHSLTVIDFCNRLIGDQIVKMNAEEIYTLLMGCYFHDTGMGITKKDYEAFSEKIDFGDYFETHSREDCSAVIRDFHNEYSGMFIRKYAPFFEIPSEEILWAVIEVARGHRKTSLMDEKAYPVALEVPGGKTICLPYLSALIRLADEIDVTAARNSKLLYDIESIGEGSRDYFEHRKHLAVKGLEVIRDAFIMDVETDDEDILGRICRMRVKMQKTLDECRQAVIQRTPYVITQKEVLIRIGGKIYNG